MKIINSKYIEFISTTIRNKDTKPSKLQSLLFDLGEEFGKEVVSFDLKELDVSTPMNQTFKGYHQPNNFVVVSTIDDYKFFASGIAKKIGTKNKGYIDVGRKRGIDVLQADIRGISLPIVTTEISTLIVAKTVLATGCTAMKLIETAIRRYSPKQLCICSAFYTQRGITEILESFPNAEIVVSGKADEIDSDGMLIPGVGDLDSRIDVA